MKSQDKKEKVWDFLGLKTDRVSWYAVLLGYLALTIALAMYLIKFAHASGFSLSDDKTDWANFGNYLGGTAGPFIGFASIMLLVATLHHQRKQMGDQSKLLALQNFEQTFFRRLDQYHRQVADFEFPLALLRRHEGSDHIEHGTTGLRQAAFFIFRGPAEEERFPPDLARFTLTTNWDSLYRSRSDWIGRLLRTLYGIFEWIDEQSFLNPAQKWQYCRIIRAQLSDTELYILFANGYTKPGNNFIHYINKYALFDNMTVSPALGLLKYLRDHENIYLESAFSSEDAKSKLGLHE
ncbi:hypothetical protein D0C27_11120 [Alcaligenes faecalis]|uniref:putative phage abortive infection protein n=1 Tax=Alcaligenes faecalis TaxID=511 RepID=UPI0010CA4DFA|nr:putative phage abortive infection protein [Alcaligenes faecalis]QCP82401.1 hypothetical protein D0C27_11120 [Alcaligenes faecalis]